MNIKELAHRTAEEIYLTAKPVIVINGVGGRPWKRDVQKGGRIGPWLPGHYEILDEAQWRAPGACLYLVGSSKAGIRYVGISRNGLNHRWRTSPAYDAETMERLERNQLFHSQCWKHIEKECTADPGVTFEVRRIGGNELLRLIENIDSPIAAFAALRDNSESVVAAVERWLCNNSGPTLATWNVAMTSDPIEASPPEYKDPAAAFTPVSGPANSKPIHLSQSNPQSANENTTASRDIFLTGAMLRNGRLYLSYSDKRFFPEDSLGERSGEKKGIPVTFVVNGQSFESDIRLSSGQRISPRRSFSSFLQSVRAREGGRVRVHRVSDRVYRLEYLG